MSLVDDFCSVTTPAVQLKPGIGVGGMGTPALGRTKMNRDQVTNWLNSATPDEIVQHGKDVLTKIGSLDKSYQDRFAQDPAFARLKQPETTG